MPIIKESSDELNPATLTTRASLARVPDRLTARDRVGLMLATCGVGYMPVAPGTWGAAIGVALYVFVREISMSVFILAESRGWRLPPLESFRTSFMLVMLICMTITGVWAASRAEPLLGRKDPGAIVIDEVVGQLIAFVFVPFNAGAWAIVAGFLAFRVFDIWKPYPIHRPEALESGLGIMADDIVAGVYAATLMSVLTSIRLLL